MDQESIEHTRLQKVKPAQAQGTLSISAPLGNTLITGILFFILLLAAGELIARTSFFRSQFIAPGVGSPHRQFEIQLAGLNRTAAALGQIDCIFLGNSMVWLGFNPVEFGQAYFKKTGEDLLCYNFGVDALTPASAGPLAEILIDQYRPKLLIYGTDPRDFAISREDTDTRVLLDNAWVQYRQGNFSLEGWLYEHSYLYRYRVALRDLLQFRFTETLSSWDPGTQAGEIYGFHPESRIAFDVNIPPDPDNNSSHIQYYFRTLKNYQVQPENTAGFQQVLDQHKQGVRIIVVEMPAPPTFVYFFENGESDYQMFSQTLDEILAENQVASIRLHDHQIFEGVCWVDYSHLNEKGAGIFSRWLGGEIGEMRIQGWLWSANH